MKGLAPSLHRVEALMEALDHPERYVPAIHITGTNGKTSCARLASAILAATGLRVGTYTSPHLQTIRERIALNGEPISPDAFGEAFEHLDPFLQVVEADLGERLTYFEILTGMFFLWATDQAVDALVVEVGLGGRWDATNVVPSTVGVITNIGLDHTGLLGTDRHTIAKEKAGIAKPGQALVTAERNPEIQAVISAEAEGAGAALSVIGRDFDILENSIAVGGRSLSFRTSRAQYRDLFLPLHGAHQGANAALAAEAVARFIGGEALFDDVIAEGFHRTVTPGRLESIRRPDLATVILDVAHNPEGMSALVGSLLEEFAFDRVTAVVGILADKDHRGMLTELTRMPCTVIAVEARNVRSVPARELADEARELGLECETAGSVEGAVAHATEITAETELICITGSHYVVGEARTYLLDDPDQT
jgi:dihydrofolate synthase / folylpolyglutamate synthase